MIFFYQVLKMYCSYEMIKNNKCIKVYSRLQNIFQISENCSFIFKIYFNLNFSYVCLVIFLWNDNYNYTWYRIPMFYDQWTYKLNKNITYWQFVNKKLILIIYYILSNKFHWYNIILCILTHLYAYTRTCIFFV